MVVPMETPSHFNPLLSSPHFVYKRHGTRHMGKNKYPKYPPLVLVTRDEWGARPSPNNTPLQLPVKAVRYVYTRTEDCDTRESCAKILRDFQEPFLRLNKQDMPYNFLVANDGTVYEGLGWDLLAYRPKKARMMYDSSTLDIAYIGNFDKFLPSPAAATGAAELVKKGMDLSKIVERPEIFHLHDFRDNEF